MTGSPLEVLLLVCVIMVTAVAGVLRIGGFIGEIGVVVRERVGA